ncbi:hypothetical protein ES703_46277 [subsurface metagenome]
MARRIIGQCSTSDFKYLEYLSDILRDGGEIDTANLTNRQKVAVRVLKHFMDCNVKYSVMLKIREVLLWEIYEGKYAFEYKLINPRDTETRNTLRGMRRSKDA